MTLPALTQSAPDFSIEQRYASPICGVDEAGRGPWAGPVVAAAVIWPEGARVPEGLNDSKKLKASIRERLYDSIMAHALVGVGNATVAEIDSTHILAATKLAMQRAVAALPLAPLTALVDGNQPPLLPCHTVPVVKGDALSLSIAAASIIAKVTRDRMMCELAQRYPAYGFERHAGYGTPAHMKALAEHGVCPAHRRSFAPIRKALEMAA